jgi:anti-anti-sigma factor
MQFKLIPKEEECILSLNGELTLPHAAQFRNELMQALDSAQRIIIDPQGLSDIDLSGMQLLCAAHQSALAIGKEILLDRDQSTVFKQRCEQAGLTCGHQCGRENNLACFWKGGDR